MKNRRDRDDDDEDDMEAVELLLLETIIKSTKRVKFFDIITDESASPSP